MTVYSADRSAAQAQLEELRQRSHHQCLLCSPEDSLGLRLEFTAEADGSVTAEIDCGDCLQSYPGLLHGGVMALLLDGAMTNCLFAAGVTAVTAEMTIRYLSETFTNSPLQLTARLTNSRSRLYLVESSLRQGGETRATAIGKFIIRSA